MIRLAELEARIGAMVELQGIVGAMRSLAGMRMRESEKALPGVRRYTASMRAAIGAAARLDPEAAPVEVAGPAALVICAGEHGFVGGFNERLLDAATHGPDDLLFIVGGRGAVKAIERGWRVAWSGAMASRPEGVLETIRPLTEALYNRIAKGDVGRVEVLFTRARTGGAASVERRVVLPLDPAALSGGTPRDAPLHNLAPALLLEQLIAEYVFSLLTGAAVESIASENAARFTTMEAAHDNLTRRLDALNGEARRARQEEITTELLDLVTGVEAQA